MYSFGGPYPGAPHSAGGLHAPGHGYHGHHSSSHHHSPYSHHLASPAPFSAPHGPAPGVNPYAPTTQSYGQPSYAPGTTQQVPCQPAQYSQAISPQHAPLPAQAPANNGVLAQEKRLFKVDMMQHSWAVVESDFLQNPIFIPPNRTNGAVDGDTIMVSIKCRPDGKLYAKVDQILLKSHHDSSQLSESLQASHPIHGQLYAHLPTSAKSEPSQLPPQHSVLVPAKHSSQPANPSVIPPMEIWTPPTTSPSPTNAYLQQSAVPFTQPPTNLSVPSSQSPASSYAGQIPSIMAPRSPKVALPAPTTSVASSYAATPPKSPYQVPVVYAPPSSQLPTIPYDRRASPVGTTQLNYRLLANLPAHSIPSSHVAPLPRIPIAANPLIEGVLMMESPTVAYVVPNDSNQVIHIPKEFLSGASNGEIVRVHIIPAKSTEGRTYGAIISIVGIHPTISNEGPESSATDFSSKDDGKATFYPDLENWEMVQESSVPVDSISSPAAGKDSLLPSRSSSLVSASQFAVSSPTLGVSSHAYLGTSTSPISQSRLHNRRPSDSSMGPQSDYDSDLPKMPEGFNATLKQIFINQTRAHPPYMSFSEFVVALDTAGEVTGLSRGLMDASMRNGWKSSHSGPDSMTFEDYAFFIQTALFGDEQSQLRISFCMMDPQQLGFITRDSVRIFIDYLFKLMLGMLLPVYLASPMDVADYIWSLIDVRQEGQATFEAFADGVSRSRLHMVGLGLAQMPTHTPTPLPKRGFPVFPGSPSWPLVLQMMVGLSRANKAVQDSDLRTLTQQSFRTTNKFELHTIMKLSNKLLFTDYAPAVFRRIRQLRGIDNAQYLHSLGVEQLLGNLLFGKFTSLAKEGSSGKSGQFFFTSHDGRFLIKTIARHERYSLYKMLQGYLAHLEKYPSSLLVPIYGLHDIDQLSVIVMGNVFNSPYAIESAWDLKGSVVGRSSPNSFIKKDLDFDRGFLFGPENAELARQIRLDALFLKSNNIVDYSMLAGFKSLSPIEIEQWELRSLSLPPTTHPYFDRGLRSYDTNGKMKNEVWFLGIIDILIQFGVLKKAENFVKSLVHNPQSISIIPPDQYCDRFSNYLVSCIK